MGATGATLDSWKLGEDRIAGLGDIDTNGPSAFEPIGATQLSPGALAEN